ncbi:MAG: glycosyltransferase family 39 protein [Gammaproteobacteria bacterium]
MTLIPQLFHVTAADYRYGRHHYVLLSLICILGVWLRFWGLGNVGLHGDEKTMVFPVLQILESGLPYLPSGMLYPRGLGQLYPMALSVWLFGPSEWALRVPSAVVGVAAILIAFFLGKRFLPPEWNLALVLIVTILPEMITQSQTARMYIFLATSVMLYVVLVFRWEQTQTWVSVVEATGGLLLSLLFHQLAIFSALLLFFPGLLHRSKRLLFQGAMAFGVVVAAFLMYRNWIDLQYGDRWRLASGSHEKASASGLQLLLEQQLWVLIGFAFVAAIALVILIYLNRDKSRDILWAWALFAGATIGCVFLYYHIGVIFFAAGSIIYIRSKGSWKPFIAFSMCLIAIFALQALMLWQYPELFPNVKKILRAMTGQPSIWPYLRFAVFFPLGAVVYLLILFYAATRLAKAYTIPDHFLFFVLGVWMPLFLMGAFSWDIELRYMFSQAALFLTALIAGLYYMWTSIRKSDAMERKYKFAAIVALPLLITINPRELQHAVNRGYEMWPDHKGAATFMKEVRLARGDVVLAEDVLQQSYYFGHVDFWLRAVTDASGRVRERDGTLYNIYTNVPLIGTGEELSNLLLDQERRAVYIIGSGETYDRRSHFLGDGILEVIEKNFPQVVYRGQDRKTVIWYFPPPGERPSVGGLSMKRPATQRD